jgi:hypothetical protein
MNLLESEDQIEFYPFPKESERYIPQITIPEKYVGFMGIAITSDGGGSR